MKDKFQFNPFSGVFEDDLDAIIVPNFDINKMILKIKDPKPKAIEFLGKQGRGKTTHLTYLHQKLSEYPIYYLHKSSNVSSLLNDTSEIVFVDSIHHLSLRDRIQLFKTKRTVIYTTHWTRKLEGYLGQKKIYTVKFKGINTKVLSSIINQRLMLAANGELTDQDRFTDEQTNRLIKKFGDDYRGIINYLFKEYQ